MIPKRGSAQIRRRLDHEEGETSLTNERERLARGGGGKEARHRLVGGEGGNNLCVPKGGKIGS